MKRKSNIFLILLILAGIALIVYPTFSDWWNSRHQSRAVASYVEQVAEMSHEDYDRMYEDAVLYNEKIAAGDQHYNLTEEEDAEYRSVLDVTGTGIMGYIEIPKIDVKLPVYHGTDEAVLQIAAGHIGGSSLPVEGASTHCVVSGHTGLPSALLFTNLDQMGEGDHFRMTVLNHVMTYEVDQIRVVLPEEIDDLKITEGENYCTLVTCTPYGINTHRLLVRGKLVANDLVSTDASAPNTPATEFVDEPVKKPLRVTPSMVIGGVVAVAALGILLWYARLAKARRRYREKRRREAEARAARYRYDEFEDEQSLYEDED